MVYRPASFSAAVAALCLLPQAHGFVPLAAPHARRTAPLFAKDDGRGAALPSFVAAARLAVAVACAPVLLHAPAAAAFEGARTIGEIPGSGLVFKDTLVVESFDDPKVQGVTLYISNFQRPLAERLKKDFFGDPSYAAVACARTGPVSVADNIKKGKVGEEVFEESKSLLFKTLRVQRLYDEEKGTVTYVSFSTRLDKNSDDNKARFKSSICAVSLN